MPDRTRPAGAASLARPAAPWLAILAAAAASFACAPEEAGPPSDREKRMLSDDVRQVTMKLYLPPQAYGVVAAARKAVDLWMYSITAFDPDGFVSEERYFDRENRLTGVVIHERDSRGRPSGTTSRSPNGDLEQRLALLYDERGRPAREEYYDAGGILIGVNDHRYDDRGRVESTVMRVDYSDGSSRISEVRYSYDGSGLVVEEEYRESPSSAVSLRVAHAYLDGRRAYSAHYQRGRYLEGRVFYTYDPDGNLIREASYQVPDDAEGLYEAMTAEEDFPASFFSSETRYEYRYFEGSDRP